MQRAAAAYRRGDWDEVNQICRAILDAQAENFHALHLSGIVAAQTGRANDAVTLLSRAVAADPGNASAHGNLGNVFRTLGRNAEALGSYDRAIALNPDYCDAYINRGNLLRRCNRAADALECYDKAISLDASRADAHNNRGNALVDLGRHAEALDSYGSAIARRPDDANFLYNRGNALRHLRRHAEAVQNYQLAIRSNPNLAAAYNNRGISLGELGRHTEALESYDRALALQPDYGEAHINRGKTLIDFERHSEAVECCERALALNPDSPNAHYNRAIALRDLHRQPEAVESFKRAIALRPDFAEARWNLANCLLSLGEFALGWSEFEWRWKTEHKARELRHFPQPLWLGAQNLKDRTILLHYEGGLGDTLHFCRYVERVAALGATVLLQVQPPLLPVLADLGGAEKVLPAGAPLPAFDFHCPLMSLPMAFHTDASSIPADIPYIHADPLRVTTWERRLGTRTKTRVGLVWSGSKSIRRRSMTLEEVLPITGDWAEWISVQKELSELDAAILARREDVRHFGDELKDFGDTAALIELTDVVVTVDTSVAHLAGAMGKPVWILLPFNSAMWTWMLEREDSAWYPTARLFRQPTIGDWASVIRRVGAELKRHFGAVR